ncbi:MAG: DNA repair protein RecN [Geobacteraceae bacterium]|nr:DNA repair protein RecN [Geobacteraceae bacterium]
MLTDLIIKNFAIIDALHVSFQPGLNMLTGETGAGKSIIIDAVNLILGGRASADMIRTGEDEAVVECLFDLAGQEDIRAMLEESGIDTDTELLIKRVVSRSGRNRVFMNGGMATTSLLGDIAPQLVNIYGQHESQTLLRPENHLYLLDGFAGIVPLRERYVGLHEEFRKTREELRQLEDNERDAARRTDLLSFQSGEIAEAALLAGEDVELGQERECLLHAEKLIRASRGAYDALYDGEGALLGTLRTIIAEVEAAGRVDGTLAVSSARLNEAYLSLEDAALSLRDYGARLEADPGRLQEVDDRLDLIHRLKRKYAPTIEEILAYKLEVDAELDTLVHREERHGELEEKLQRLELALREEGRELTRQRTEAAKRLCSAMERELHELAMKNAHFDVAFTSHDEPRATGMERVEFLFSPNPGEAPKPLARIASGGELSRLMLAMKQIHPESDVPTLIFDEVDTGIGGAVSAMVGKKLKRVSRNQQVLCITHHPQVAAFADHHFKVNKATESGRTRTSVDLLAGDARVMEVARMLSGAKITEKTLEHAREMMEDAQCAGPARKT